MTDKQAGNLFPAVVVLSIFFPCGEATANVPLCLVFVHKLLYLTVQCGIVLLQSLGQIFMDGGFGYAKFLSGGAYGAACFDHVHSQLAGPIVDILHI